MCLCSQAFAAEKKSPFEPAKALFADQSAQYEREIAQLIMLRASVPAADREKLEMRIDLRILCRWMLKQAAVAQSGSNEQASARLRARLAATAMAVLESTVLNAQYQLTEARSDVLAALHELTFDLDQHKAAAGLDQVSHNLGEIVLALAGPANLSAKNLQPVRPKPIEIAQVKSARKIRTAAELAAEVRLLNVSAPLREQLLSAAIAASEPAGGDAEAVRQAGLMRQMLEDATDMAKGLASNLGVEPAARQAMERQLAEGLALFIDARTRAAGTAKLEALAPYRQLLVRIGNLKLTPDQIAQFAPMFAWAREHSDELEKVLAAVERYQSARMRFAGRATLPTTMPSARRAYDELEKRFATAHVGFIVAAAALPKAGPVTRPAFELQTRAEEMARAIDLLEKTQRLPNTIDVLCSFGPKNPAAVERRLWSAAVSSASPVDSDARRQAWSLIDGVDQVARLVREMPAPTHAQVPVQLDQRWTGGRLLAMGARWRRTVAEIGTGFGGGGAADPAKLAKLNAAAGLYESLADGVLMDLTLAHAAVALDRWVDWRIGLDELRPLLMPYPSAMAEAFGGFLGDTPGWEESWEKTRREFQPIIAEINRAAMYRDQCTRFPGGVHWMASCLMTPMENAPFANERWFGYAVWAWKAQRDAGRAAEADAIFQAIVARMKSAE